MIKEFTLIGDWSLETVMQLLHFVLEEYTSKQFCPQSHKACAASVIKILDFEQAFVKFNGKIKYKISTSVHVEELLKVRVVYLCYFCSLCSCSYVFVAFANVSISNK